MKVTKKQLDAMWSVIYNQRITESPQTIKSLCKRKLLRMDRYKFSPSITEDGIKVLISDSKKRTMKWINSI